MGIWFLNYDIIKKILTYSFINIGAVIKKILKGWLSLKSSTWSLSKEEFKIVNMNARAKYMS